MIATLKNQSIHESNGVKLTPISYCTFILLLYIYESILLQLVFDQNKSRSLVICIIISIIFGPE